MKLYGYWRSSAAFRLRIALNLKNLAYEQVPVNIAPGKDEQKAEPYLALNPQGRVPALETDDGVLTQSMAILDWLEEAHPTPALLPGGAFKRAQVRAFADVIACDIHPINNLAVLQKLKADLGASQQQTNDWYGHWISVGFAALEAMLAETQTDGPFAFGAEPTFADVCLVPQMWNARRFNVDLSDMPRLVAIDAHCQSLDAFKRAAPENQPDAISAA